MDAFVRQPKGEGSHPRIATSCPDPGRLNNVPREGMPRRIVPGSFHFKMRLKTVESTCG